MSAFASSRRRAEVAPRVGVLVDVRVRRPRRRPRRPRRLAPDWIQRVPGIRVCVRVHVVDVFEALLVPDPEADHLAEVFLLVRVILGPRRGGEQRPRRRHRATPRWVPHPLITALTKNFIGSCELPPRQPDFPDLAPPLSGTRVYPTIRGATAAISTSRAGGDIARESPRPGRRRRQQRAGISFLPSGPFASEKR